MQELFLSSQEPVVTEERGARWHPPAQCTYACPMWLRPIHISQVVRCALTISPRASGATSNTAAATASDKIRYRQASNRKHLRLYDLDGARRGPWPPKHNTAGFATEAQQEQQQQDPAGQWTS